MERLSPVEADWQQLVASILVWAEAADNIRSAAITGSRARSDRPADDWSDLDLFLFAADPSRLIDGSEWLENIAPVWTTLVNDAPVEGFKVRQVVFEGGLDVDFVPIQAGSLQTIVQIPEIGDTLGRGFQPLLDKDGELMAVRIPPVPDATQEPISPAQFDWAVNDFLFQTVARKGVAVRVLGLHALHHLRHVNNSPSRSPIAVTGSMSTRSPFLDQRSYEGVRAVVQSGTLAYRDIHRHPRPLRSLDVWQVGT